MATRKPAAKPLTFQQAMYAGMQPLGNSAAAMRAASEAQLRYSPQIESLLMLLGQRRHQQTLDVQQVRRGGLASAGGVSGVRTSFLQQLSDTPPPTSEAAAHLGLTRDAVAGALAQMQAQQYAGINSGVAAARRNSQLDQSGIRSQLLSAGSQGALYNQSEFNALSDSNRKFAAQQRNAKNTLLAGLAKAGLDQTGKPIPGLFNRIHPGKTPHAPVDGIDYQTYLGMSPQERATAHKQWVRNGGGSKGGLSASAANSFRQQFSTAIHYANTFKAHLSPSEMVSLLITGRPAQPTYANQKVKNANGSISVKRVRVGTVPAIKAVSDPLAVHAAVQQAINGGVTKAVIRKLRAAGYDPAALGIKEFKVPPPLPGWAGKAGG